MSSTIEAQQHQHHQIAGHKAALHNPNISDEAKAHSAEVLVASGLPLAEIDEKHHRAFHSQHPHGAVPVNPLGLDENDPALKVDMEKAVEHEKHVIAGFKAVEHNPNSSAEAKQHAHKVLEEAGTK